MNRKILAISVLFLIAIVTLGVISYDASRQSYHHGISTSTPISLSSPAKQLPFVPKPALYVGWAEADLGLRGPAPVPIGGHVVLSPGVSFGLQNLGNARATQVNVTVTVNWQHSEAAATWNYSRGPNPYAPSGWTGVDDNGNAIGLYPVFTLVYTTFPLIPKIDVEETINYCVANKLLGPVFPLMSTSQFDYIESFVFTITCAQNVTKTFTINA